MVQLLVAPLDEIRQSIGKESEPRSVDIEKGAIRKFARAVGDENPLFFDEEYARKSKFGGIVAPEDIVFGYEFNDTGEGLVLPAPRVLDGGGEFHFFLPTRPGDTLTFRRKLIDLSERQGKVGKMHFLTYETAWTNQRGELVAKALTTVISY